MKLYTRILPDIRKKDELHDAAYALLLEVLEQDWNVRDAKIEKTSLGRPYLVGDNMPYISLSHTRGFVCCAVSEVPVGIDCERKRRITEGAVRRVCTQKELEGIRTSDDPTDRFLRLWTLKESISKKLGVGLTQPFQSYEIEFDGGNPVCAGHTLFFELRDGFYLAAAE